MSSGNFRSVDTEQGVTGAPRSDSVGKVFIYDLETFEMFTQLRGEQVKSLQFLFTPVRFSPNK